MRSRLAVTTVEDCGRRHDADAEPLSHLELARRIAFIFRLGMLEKAKADAAGDIGN